jgi:hypothetical protein
MFESSIALSDFLRKIKLTTMTTATNNETNTAQANNKSTAFVCACCLTFFPVIYLVGVTVKGFLG